MTRMAKKSTAALAAALAGFAWTADAATVGQDDFDGNQTYSTRTITPDGTTNGQSNAAFGNGQAPTFGGSFRDLWGIGGRTPGDVTSSNGESFAVWDDSQNGFTSDNLGFQGPTANNFLIAADTVNNNNPSGAVQAQWTFDISNYQNLSLSLDILAYGDFETDDVFSITAQVDAGPIQSMMAVNMDSAQDGDGNPANDTFYSVTMAGGSTHDKYKNIFWTGDDDDDHAFLMNNLGSIDPVNGTVNPGTGNLIRFHDADANQDGIVDEPVLSDASNQEDAFAVWVSSGSFWASQTEHEAYKDPLYVDITGGTQDIQLDNQFQTFTNGIAGTGTTLTITVEGTTNSGPEFIVFDDLLITGDLASLAILGDYNNTGKVGQGDLSLVLQNWGDTEANATALAAWVNDSQVDGDGTIGQGELSQVLQNWGDTSLTLEEAVSLVYDQTGLDYSHLLTSVPEPGSLALMGVGGLMLLRRRKA